LEFDEFAVAVNKLYGENLPDEAIKMLLRDADTNNDQVVSYDEFVRFLEVEGLSAKARAQQSKDNKEIPPLKLHYFNGRGRAEGIRLVFAEAGIPFEDKRWESKDFQASLKSKVPFGQMPVLEIGKEGKMLAQSAAISRYVARLGGLYGANDLEAAKVDQVFECAERDLGAPLSAAAFSRDEKAKAEMLQKFWSVTAPQYLSSLEKLLAQNNKGNGYFVGNSATLADIHFYNLASWMIHMQPTVLNKYPLLHQLVTRVASRPHIADYLKKRPASAW